MKKYILLIISLFLILSIFAIAVSAAGVVVTVDNKSCAIGEIVTLDVTISDAVTAYSGAVEVVYDKNVLELVEAKWHMDGALLSTFDTAKNKGAFAYQANKTISGKIFSVTFRVLGNAPTGKTDVECNIQLKEGSNNVSVTNNKGSINVICEHNFNEKSNEFIASEATCTTPATYYYSCSICGTKGTTTYTDGSALSHSYNAVVTAPTCTEQGYTTHTCHRGDSYVDSCVNALGHEFGEWYEVTSSTCTEAGTEQHDCSRCDHFEIRETKPAGHIPSDWIVDTEPTFETNGTKHKECMVCNAVLEQSIVPSLTHSYVSTVIDPTCTEQGYTSHTCSECGNIYVDDYTNELGHNFGEWRETKAPTCIEVGTKQRDCSRCDHAEVRDIDALGHDIVIHAGKEPTTNEDGWKEYETCTRCDYSTYEDISAQKEPVMKKIFEFILAIFIFLFGLFGIVIK